MRCVVTGATGHIGNVLVRKLYKKGYEVVVFVLRNDNIDMFKELNIEYKYGDVNDIESLENAFAGADVVFHLAGIIEIGNGNKAKMYKVNVEGTKNVVDVCKKVGVKKLVYTSSVHAIKEQPKG